MEAPNDNELHHFCAKSLNLEIEITKMKQTLEKLRERCNLKNKEIKRLRDAAKRSTLRISSLKALLTDLKQQELISSETEELLNVRVFNNSLF